ncbi:E3 ubiquitin-protein ligase RMA3 [Apostasia shenzhenica]|uniref:E3 ubiquitin-protein ligase RMA n=1 Tax=Apostasia shenzhenica TaxID=1088818 RepID=A0A2I0A870_9ASPA|nr:E3 ubiquitin-protein ligase RMA3 [Apostasia shenzhenica]
MGSPPRSEVLETATGGASLPESSAGAGAGGCFDCNICLDFAVDPVVTLCGHLYCRPCIVKWLHVEAGGASPASCPVCKASLWEDSLVPLYGRGNPQKRQPKGHGIIPRRPSLRRRQQTYHHHLYHPYPVGGEFSSLSSSSSSYTSSPAMLGSPRRMTSTAAGLLEEVAMALLPWLFRNHPEMAAAAAAYGRLPYSGGARRQEMLAEWCLNQTWMFLFCCAILFLLLF